MDLYLANMIEDYLKRGDIDRWNVASRLSGIFGLQQSSTRRFVENLTKWGDAYGYSHTYVPSGRRMSLGRTALFLYAVGVPPDHPIIGRIREIDDLFSYPPTQKLPEGFPLPTPPAEERMPLEETVRRLAERVKELEEFRDRYLTDQL